MNVDTSIWQRVGVYLRVRVFDYGSGFKRFLYRKINGLKVIFTQWQIASTFFSSVIETIIFRNNYSSLSFVILKVDIFECYERMRDLKVIHWLHFTQQLMIQIKRADL
jgi:hypothetical protein